MPLSKEKFTDVARERIRETRSGMRNWRVDAMDDFAFVSGDQWIDADAELLREQQRPAITFNYSEKMVDAVVGAEISNRQEVTYRPRGKEDSGLADVWNAAGKWARDECGAEDEESDGFRDMLICGLGWTQTRMSYDEDKDGKVIVERVDPLEMYYDRAAFKAGLMDRRYNFRLWWVDEREAKREWPDAIFTGDDSGNTATGVITRGHRYQDDEPDEEDRHKDQVQICHYECMEKEPIWRVATDTGIQEIDEKTFADMREHFDAAGMQYVKQYKRVYYRGFFADETLLEFEPSPCQDGFTFQAITGKRDRNRNTWYGLTRVMKDPQRWANKWLSQILHIINSNAKGGLMAEVNAFVDPQKAQDEWAQPDSITMFKEGALSGGKVQPKTPGNYPAGLDKLMTFALGSLPMVTGINLEALGLANREQANVLEQSRKQAAYGLLAPLFDGLRRYRKSQGRILLSFINKFISDGRLIRIGGPDNEQFIPLTKTKDAIEYDIIVDSAPNSPDSKEQTWETLQALVPAMLKAGMPLPPDLVDYAPIPTALALKWKQFAAQQQQQQIPPQIQQQLQQMQQELQQLQQENMGLKQNQQTEVMGLQQKGQQSQAELALKAQNAQAELALKRNIAEQEFALETWKQEREFELAQRQANFDQQLQHAKVAGELAIKDKASEAAAKPAKELALAIDMHPIADAITRVSENHSAAMENLSKALNRPRKLLKDSTGQPIGSAPSD